MWQKDYQLLIKVFAKVKRKTNNNLILSIAGTGPLKNELIQLIQKLKLQKCIKLLGTVERKDIPSFLSSLDLYVQSSISEG